MDTRFPSVKVYPLDLETSVTFSKRLDVIVPILFAIGMGTAVICAAKCKNKAILIRKNGEGRPLVRVDESVQSLDVIVFKIEDMTCFEITYAIYQMLMDAPGVKEVNTKRRYKWVAVVFDPEIVRKESLRQVLEKHHLRAREIRHEKGQTLPQCS